MRVIDSSSLAKFTLKEPSWELVRNALSERCISIELSIKEVANSIWKRALTQELTLERARQTLARFLSERPFEISDQGELYEEAFKIALKTKSTIYDSLYVELARRKSLTLVTSDKVQARVAKETGVETLFIE